MSAKNVIFRDERNIEVQSRTIDVADGYTDVDLPFLIARQDRHHGAPGHFRVLRVLECTGDRDVDRAALLVAHAELVEEDAAKLRGMLIGPQARSLREDGIDDAWIAEHYDAEAVRLRVEASKLTAGTSPGAGG
jgi:hypothetical protein